MTNKNILTFTIILLFLLSIGSSCKLGSFAWKCESEKDCKSNQKCIKGQCFDDLPPVIPPKQEPQTIMQQINNNGDSKATKTCAAAGGIPCGGCCKELISSIDVQTCCAANACVNRIQQKKTFSDLGEATIELFSSGELGIWYGGGNVAGKENYASAQTLAENKYAFNVNGKDYTFTATKNACELSVS